MVEQSGARVHTLAMDKGPFTLRLLRCLLIGLGAFIMILALDIQIRSPLDVTGYVLGAGGLWYAFELIVMSPRKKRPPTEVEKQYQAQNQPPSRSQPKKPTDSALGEDHFD